ncbi:MAG: glycosyltransferase family 4 protein [Lachnospiraceae bacterium]|nr:glycosyltransferase family 4 protein [Lachnospiraceae bacterium]
MGSELLGEGYSIAAGHGAEAKKPVLVLVSAMHLKDWSLIRKLRITGNAVLINQCDEDDRRLVEDGNRRILFLSNRDRGLSRSRNLAMREAASFSENSLCIFCDNDICYVEGYEDRIRRAFDRHPESDILVFFIKRPERQSPIFQRERRMGYLSTMKIFSPEIAFRLDRIRRAGLQMDRDFGAGARYCMGEENIFLFDALRKGLRISYIPEKIADVIPTQSTWFQGYTEDFFRNRGAGYYRMTSCFWFLLCLQFAVRKHSLYRQDQGFCRAISLMIEGKRHYLRNKGSGGRKAFPTLFIVGDYRTGTGPANVTRDLIRSLPKGTLFLRARGKAARAAELFQKMPKANVAVFSGFSRQNLLGMKLARRLGIPSIYLMHGCVEYENRINRVPDKAMARDERRMMALCDRILAVSDWFEGWLRCHYPDYKEKIYHLTNGIDWKTFSSCPTGEKGVGSRSRSMAASSKPSILTVGGGMPRKRIYRICQAIDILRREGMTDLTLTLVGDRGADTERIHRYPFVRDLGLVDRETMKKLYASHSIFVQNSIFETFGLAPVEALLGGANILLSDCCGVLSVLENVQEGDLIRNPENAREIADKLKGLMKQGNHDRLLAGIDRKTVSIDNRAGELQRFAATLV